MKAICILLLLSTVIFGQTNRRLSLEEQLYHISYPTNRLSTNVVNAIDILLASATTEDLLDAFQSTISIGRQFAVAEKIVARGDRTVIPALVPMLQSTNPADRCNAAFIPAAFADDRGIDLLIREMGDRSPLTIFAPSDEGRAREFRDVVRHHVSILLALLKDRRAVPVLIQSLEDDVGYGAAYALAMIGDPAAIPVLLDRLDRTNDHTRMSFAYALGSLGHPKGTATMIEFLSFPDWGDQVRALEALGEFGDERALGPVSKALRDPHANVRVAAAQALGEIGGAAEISALEAIYTDNTQRPCFSPITVGEAASQAVVRIRSRLALPDEMTE